MTRQVPEPGQGIIMWKSNRKEDERKNGWFYVYRNLVVRDTLSRRRNI